jgi:hypothetical protein
MGNQQANGKELLDFIVSLGELEWARFENRFFKGIPEARIEPEDRSSRPPYTQFRFKLEDPQVVDKLKRIVASYSGELSWVMTAHDRTPLPGTNWMICPRIVEDRREEASKLKMTVAAFFEQRFPEFGPKAYCDLLGLVEHIRENW